MKDKLKTSIVQFKTINKHIDIIDKNIVSIFKNIYIDAIKDIVPSININFEKIDMATYKQTIHIEPELRFGSFFIDILYENGTLSVDYEDNLNACECYAESNTYECLAVCYNVLNQISINVKNINDAK